MANTETNSAREPIAVGPIMGGSQGAVIVNPNAEASSLFAWSAAQLKALDDLLMVVSCSQKCGIDFDPHEFALTVREFSVQALQTLNAGIDALNLEHARARHGARAPS